MRLVSFRADDDSVQAGAVRDDGIAPLGTDLLSIIGGGEEALRRARQTAGTVDAISRERITLLAPLPRPPKLICVGLNYLDHARESKMEVPNVPTIFSKFTNAIIGPGASIVLPKKSTKPDYEAEFAFVIGKHGRYIPEERWREYVFGYTIINDVSARDFQMATTQWLMGKTFDTFAPMGPHILTANNIADPHSLNIRMTINGEVLQDSNTRELIFKIPALLAYLSSVMTLEPGDVVSTGTPAGVGAGRNPQRWLRPGDECVVQVEGIGELRNPVVAES
jgi:2-keto-4-pentenoate hydratase/2-oxohepta-3-ene-1,7-dioic acid hydratase in catechol pathway